MRKVLSVVTCSVLAACSCADNQWEEVDSITYEDPYEDQVIIEPSPAQVIVEEQVYTPAPQPQPAYSCPCTVQPMPCYQPVCYQPCPCMQPVMPAPQPKITTTKKVITTTTTVEEPCGKPVCEPVVTTHEEIIPSEVSYAAPVEVNYNNAPAPVSYSNASVNSNNYAQPMPGSKDYVEVTVEKNPYRSEVVSMQSANSKVAAEMAAKYSPEAYDVVATRAANRMLQDTAPLYDNGTKLLFLKDTKLMSSDLPYGSQRLKSTLKDVIGGTKVYDLVNNSKNADYILASTADWYVTNNAAPALQYRLSMFDKNGRKVNEWVELIRQVQE